MWWGCVVGEKANRRRRRRRGEERVWGERRVRGREGREGG